MCNSSPRDRPRRLYSQRRARRPVETLAHDTTRQLRGPKCPCVLYLHLATSLYHIRLTYHLSRLSPTDGELEICILLPVAEEQRELRQKLIVGVSGSCDSLRARVSVQSTLL